MTGQQTKARGGLSGPFSAPASQPTTLEGVTNLQTGPIGKLSNRLLHRLAEWNERRVYAPNTRWFENREFLDAAARFPDESGIVHDRRFNLFFLARAFAHVPGEMADCGIYYGRSSHLLLTAVPGKPLHCFDSFEGLSEPKTQDGGDWRKHQLSVAEDVARANLAEFEGRFTFYKGWIPERFDEVSEKRFSIVHVDVDLYEPTRAAHEFFWPRLNPGGIMICDDYGSIHCPGARRAVDEFAASVGQAAAELTTIQSILVKPCS